MRLERLNYNKLKVFLTYDDLKERGLTKEDLWTDTFKVKQLFREMIEQASQELNFEPTNSLSVEVFSLQAQGMVVFVTKQYEEETSYGEFDEDEFEDFIEMQVMLDESEDMFFEFDSFEDVIQLTKRMSNFYDTDSVLYSFEKRFYVLLDYHMLSPAEVGNMIAVLAEYGNPSTITKHRVNEYGKMLVEKRALEYINSVFS
ncbi:MULTISPECIES: genetic competence negative regulator [Priestia]|jgi:adapter protein MecA 1/2|uniref:Adapter protein MecA n=5 Tax=Priestia TaxID=2800373 RepID=A0A125PL96_PRIMG|nr:MULTISPECIES: genetic competence negative regulator [Priestia]MBU8850889.1 genetic competence negative regulator [Bacillus sp. FJAT-26377]RCX27167.1 adapter protein MecA 1/2 [Bacillus sp. AG236]ADF41171.1 negative regulator of genetic competence [Priestia megaterium DSM 319]AEN87761.1 Genetic competence negative regulator MecA-like protein [Priestia megaterium WSH-002]AJI21685.1 negative regulator of genetic competence family protein [Priestia megaterium NBRC 15308 = ATCC 14581]